MSKVALHIFPFWNPYFLIWTPHFGWTPRFNYILLQWTFEHAIFDRICSRQRSKGARSFEVRTSSSQVTQKKVDNLFLVVALKTQKPPTPLRLFHCQNKTNKAVSGQISVKFLFSVHTITDAKQSNRQDRARAVDLPADLTWRTLV